MHPLTPLDHLLALVLAVFFPIRSATFGYRRLAEAAPSDVPRVRRALFTQAMVIQWTLATVVVASWAVRARTWASLGLAWRTDAWSLGTAVCLALMGGIIAAQLPRARRDPVALARVRERLAHVRRMLPERDDEMGRFYGLAFTAGVCEELLYRGYLFDYARHFLPWPAAAAVAVLLFAAGHSYQGARGVLATGIAGAVLMAMVLVSGSLYLAMLGHMLLDAYSGALGRRAFAAETAPGAGASDAGAASAAPAPEAHAGPPGPGILPLLVLPPAATPARALSR